VSSVARLTSRDGTSIAYERRGSGPAVILVTGGLDDGTENEPLAAELAGAFTTYNYARRGRGESGDTRPYALERELEDLDALIEAAGGTAHVFGVSSGGALALEAAAAGLAAERLAVYEVPYVVTDDGAARWREYVDRLDAALDADRRNEALELFMRLAGSSEEGIAAARSSPLWPGLRELAHTLAYDAACLGDGRPPASRLTRVVQPTLVATGGGQPDFFEPAGDAIAAALPRAERLVLDGLGHVPDPKTLAPVLMRFFAA
jgi:pimeloyl-ACP methyl ester carboxylesterase